MIRGMTYEEQEVRNKALATWHYVGRCWGFHCLTDGRWAWMADLDRRMASNAIYYRAHVPGTEKLK